ncbi:hypothetical protein EIMP300_27610 [Escherichia coli]|uniref:FAD-binding PCMH-type domain-containing protein n=1 Tax=Escherichia coli TaxID=562 RepID=A0A8S0FMJ8_ECOLX|nr:hypothetical protein EIMP300_27610 [Escherichia coli]
MSVCMLAGGTDVLIQLHHHNDRYRHIVDIHNLAELRGITLAEDGALRIGSATTFTQLIEDPVTQRHLPALCAAAASIAGPQIRNVATYGGNICNGATSADSATPTLIYDAKLEIHSPRGVRFVPINGFHTGPGKVSLEHDEILVAFHFPPQPKEHAGSAHFKYAMRDAMDIQRGVFLIQQLAAPHIADWITAISANYAWHLVLPRQRRFAANMPNRLHKMRH